MCAIHISSLMSSPVLKVPDSFLYVTIHIYTTLDMCTIHMFTVCDLCESNTYRTPPYDM